MTKIYTKSGDKGSTSLYSGQRVSKDSPRVSAYGDIDELNSILGVIRSQTVHDKIAEVIIEIQSTLMSIGAELSSTVPQVDFEVVTSSNVDFLERQIDVISEKLEKMDSLVLPGGGKTASFLHLARAICRRAERSIVHLNSLSEEVSHWILVYINRLSDFLFVLARLSNQLENIKEIPWKVKKH